MKIPKIISDDGSVFEIPQLGMCLHRWSVETMLAGLFGDLYFGDSVRNLIEIPRLISNVHTMFEASTRLQTVSSQKVIKGTVDK